MRSPQSEQKPIGADMDRMVRAKQDVRDPVRSTRFGGEAAVHSEETKT